MIDRLLIVICQKVGSTGSGVVVRELAREAAGRAKVMVLCGAAAEDDPRSWLGSENIDVRAVQFSSNKSDALPFDVVGMSNEMPYPSTTFATLEGERLQQYLNIWERKIAEAVREFQPTVVHVHHLWVLVHVTRAVAPHIPLVVSLHGTDLQRAVDAEHIKALVSPSLSTVNSFIALTQESVRNACKVYNLDTKHFMVLGNGFNHDVFNPSHEIDLTSFGEKSRSLGVTPLVLFVGKYSGSKGINYLIRAMRRVRDRSRIRPILWILGSGPDHSRKSFIDLIEREGLDDDVCLWGQVHQVDVAAAMKLAHVLVMPSFQEPFGLVWLEAMACGTRLVTTNQGGPAEFVPPAAREKGYATLIRGLSSLSPTLEEKEQYTEDLAAAIEWQIQQPLSRSVRFEIASMVQHLTWERYADRLFDVYEQVS